MFYVLKCTESSSLFQGAGKFVVWILFESLDLTDFIREATYPLTNVSPLPFVPSMIGIYLTVLGSVPFRTVVQLHRRCPAAAATTVAAALVPEVAAKACKCPPSPTNNLPLITQSRKRSDLN